MIYNFCGDTKGKTSSALGTVMRALGAQKRVRIVFFMKHWNTSETEFLKKMKESYDIDFYLSGDKEFIYASDITDATLKEAKEQLKFGNVEKRDDSDIEKAQRGIKKAEKYLEENPFLLVLDELNYAVSFGLVAIEEARQFLAAAREKGVHVVITGRDLHKELAKECDLITEMKKVKHPFDVGVHAVKGLDY